MKILNREGIEKLKQMFLDGEISVPESYIILKDFKRRLYGLKYWKDIRKSLISECCENCNSTEKLTLQHTKQPELPIWRDAYAAAKFNKDEASNLQLLGYINSFIEYLDCGNTKTLCNRCAYAEDFRDSTRMFCDLHNIWYYSKYDCEECREIAREKKMESIIKVQRLLVETFYLSDDALIETAKSLEGETQYWYVVKMNAYYNRVIEPYKHFIEW